MSRNGRVKGLDIDLAYQVSVKQLPDHVSVPFGNGTVYVPGFLGQDRAVEALMAFQVKPVYERGETLEYHDGTFTMISRLTKGRPVRTPVLLTHGVDHVRSRVETAFENYRKARRMLDEQRYNDTDLF